MTLISRRAWAMIDLAALKKNLSLVRTHSPNSGIYAVIKSNAYGHGMAELAAALIATLENNFWNLMPSLALKMLWTQALMSPMLLNILKGYINLHALGLRPQGTITQKHPSTFSVIS